MKPFSNNEASNSGKNHFSGNAIISDKEIVITMNRFFTIINKKLDFELYKNSTLSDVDSFTCIFDNQINIKKIREYFPDIGYGDFHFTGVSLEGLKKETLNLNVKKPSANGSIPTKVLKQNAEMHLSFLAKSINHIFTKSDFPRELKNSEVIPVYKKEDPPRKKNYRPVSLLPHVSKVFKRIICQQIPNYYGKETM